MGIHSYRLYDKDVAVLKDYGGIKSRITVFKALRNSGIEVDRKHKYRGKQHDHKLRNNISRAKSKVFEYAYCNPWEYFVTLTIDGSKYQRDDLGTYYKAFGQWLRDYKKKYHLDFAYVLIPELHKDGKSWHMHGLMHGLPYDHLTVNDNGYLDWEPYRLKFGYISIDRIRDQAKTASYITKYISKDLSKCVTECNAKMYYCSRGLKTATEVARGTLIDGITPDFENEYLKLQWFDNDVSVDALKAKFFNNSDNGNGNLIDI